MLVCESVTALLYPFTWPHVYVPILPPALETFLDAPVPYIMGLLRRTHDIELYKSGTVAIVDIDNGELVRKIYRYFEIHSTLLGPPLNVLGGLHTMIFFCPCYVVLYHSCLLFKD
jgi:hypothetical protein